MYTIRTHRAKPMSKIFYRIYREDGKFMQTYNSQRDAAHWVELYGERYAIKSR